MRSSISRRLVLWLAIPLMLLALCGGLAHYFNQVAPDVIASDHRLREATHHLSARVTTLDGRTRIDLPPESPERQSASFALRDLDGHLLDGDAGLPAVPLRGNAAQLNGVVERGGRSQRALTTRVDSTAGPLLLTVTDPRSAANPGARFGFMSTLLWDFVQLDVTLVLVWIGIRVGLGPIKRLRDELAARSPLDLRPVDEVQVPRELAPLAATLNRLLAMVRTSVQSQQQFIANTAHQLRTPLTGIQAQLDLLAGDPAAEPVRARVVAVQEGMRQLAHSANQLLSLARADPSANLTARHQTVDLAAIVAEVVSKHFDRALTLGIDLGVEAEAVALEADPALIDDLLTNLVDNALKYTPRGGRVTVSTGTHGGRPYLAVEDSGPGIPLAERPHVRQRFYRLPNSPGHGSGLGLAIVEDIAKLYKGSLAIETAPGGVGTRMLVVL